MRALDLLLAVGLVLIALAIAVHDPRPQLLVEDTTKSAVWSQVHATPAIAAAIADPAPKPAHAWWLNSVCQIDEHQTPEHVV